MTTTLQQMLAEPKALLDLARNGEEVLLTEGGKPVVRLTSVPATPSKPAPGAVKAWVERAADEAAASATGKHGKTADEIVAELREDRTAPTDAEMESRRKWLDRVTRRAIEASTGKTGGPTTEEIIDDIRPERC